MLLMLQGVKEEIYSAEELHWKFGMMQAAAKQ